MGPSVGSVLYAMDTTYPALAASALFIVNIIICLTTIPEYVGSTPKKSSPESHVQKKESEERSFLKDVKILAEYRSVLLGPLCCFALITFVERSMKESNVLSYFEIRYNMETKNIGYVNSISTLFAFLANSLLVKPFISWCGGSKEHSMVIALILCGLASSFEYFCKEIYEYIIFVVPLFMVSSNVVMTLSKSVLSCAVPHEHIGKTLAVLGVLESAIGVIAPLYGTHCFAKLGYCSRGWLSGIHYAIAAGFLWLTLVYNSPPDGPTMTSAEKKKSKKED